MKKLILIVTALFLFASLKAQIIEGTIYDADSKEPLAGVIIYLNGTSIYTSSDSNGYFRLVVKDKINTSLIFSLLSYESLIIENPFESRVKSFFLKEKPIDLTEAVIIADGFSRAQKMKAFKEQFLGDGREGKSCSILNEDDIVLKYDPIENRMTAFSMNPLIIKNDYLAYLITFDLHSFSIQYSTYTLNKTYIEQLFYMGTSSFVDENPFNLKIAKRREEKHTQSRQYFWKNLASNTLEGADIIIYNNRKPIEADQYFNITDTLNYSLIHIKPETDLNRTRNNIVDPKVYGIITVIYDYKLSSEVVFMTDRIHIDKFGNIDAIDKIYFSGAMGKQRVGDMLPLNYTQAGINKMPANQ